MKKHSNSIFFHDEDFEECSKVGTPTLYDLMLTQETLSFQVRKQNKILDKLHEKLSRENKEKIEFLNNEIDLQNEEINGLKAALSKQEELTTGLIDSFYNYLNGIEENMSTIQKTIPSKSSWFRRSNLWKTKTTQLIHSVLSGSSVIRKKVCKHLDFMGIKIITPEVGENFLPSLHRAVDHTEGGTPGTIANVLRVGFRKGETVLRFADVTIYH